MKTRYNFHLDDEHLAHLRDLAHRENTTVSEIIRYAIADHLKRHDPKYVPANSGQLELDFGRNVDAIPVRQRPAS